MKLADALEGGAYRVAEIVISENVKQRLEILGMTEGTEVLLINKKRSGTVIVKVRGTRLAVGAAFARRIIVGGV